MLPPSSEGGNLNTRAAANHPHRIFIPRGTSFPVRIQGSKSQNSCLITIQSQQMDLDLTLETTSHSPHFRLILIPFPELEPMVAMTGFTPQTDARRAMRPHQPFLLQSIPPPPFILPTIILPATKPEPIHIISPTKVALPVMTQMPVASLHCVPWNYTPIIPQKAEELVFEISGITRFGRCYTSPEVEEKRKGKGKEGESANPLTEQEISEFSKALKKNDYDIMEQLRKTSAHISMLGLLLSSETHRDALLRILKDAHVPESFTPDNLHDMISLIMAPNIITFSDDEISIDGTGHTRALHITLKTRGDMVSSVRPETSLRV